MPLPVVAHRKEHCISIYGRKPLGSLRGRPTSTHKKQSAARIGEGRVIASPINIANAVVIKNDDVFFLAQHGGAVPMGNEDGFGLYYH